MLRRLWIVLVLGILLLLPSSGCADGNRMLECALSYLEEGNPFLVRYNEIHGTEIEPVCPLGCPYFYGGNNVRHLLKTVHPDHESDYYRLDQTYLYGLDCSGYIRNVFQAAGYDRPPRISELLNRTLYGEYAVNRALTVMGEERTAVLKIGDLLALQHEAGGFHIAIFCGTLRDYGYTAETLPEELAPYLDYPLLIHSTASSDYHERYRLYLEEQGLSDVVPPYGGVIVTILDVPPETAPAQTPEVKDLSRPCFELERYHLQVTDLAEEKRVRWIRWRQKTGE